MTRSRLTGIACVLLILLALPANAQQVPPDREGCKDSPLLSRIAGCYIYRCAHNEWDALKIMVAPGKEQSVEGQLEDLYYECPVDFSRLKIVRNAEAALRQAGYTVVFNGTDSSGNAAVTARKGPQWVAVTTGSDRYWVKTVKAKEMAQEMVANAATWANDITATGHAAVYGLYFDTDKADIKPESAPALQEMAKLLKASSALTVFIVGHTDNTGEYLHNLALSEARAVVVVTALTTKHGVAASRLKGMGVGPLAPVASNKTEDGRARNRRVELVER